MKTLGPAFLLALTLVACSGSKGSGQAVTGEGEICAAGGQTCASTQSCAATGQLAGSADVCRTNCSAGCSNGETCNAFHIKNTAGADDGTCQCVPNASCGSSDACTPAGLVCHPDFYVCVPTEPAGTQCPTGTRYSPLCSLCVISG